jgi:quercetin dioxygenase-like cupin family protein
MNNQNFCSRTLTLVLAIALFGAGPAAAQASEKQKAKPASANFIAFGDAEYHTSPDKRIGAKILVDPAKVGPSIATMVHLTYLPGAHIGSHRHVFVTEVIHVLEGNLTLRIGDEVKVLGPNSTAYIPAKAFHEYMNDSTDVVKFLQYYSPSGPEEEYRNWTKPSSETEAAAAPKSQPTQEKSSHIVSPPMPPVPGSPTNVKLGSVVEKTGTAPAKTTEEPKTTNTRLLLKNLKDKHTATSPSTPQESQ